MVRGVAMTVWKHVPATAAEAFARARGHGAREFLVYWTMSASPMTLLPAPPGGGGRCWRERGLNKGDRVALVMRNLPEWPVVFMGALLAGAIVVPLNAWWTGTELAYGILDCGRPLCLCRCRAAGAAGRPAAVVQQSLSPAPPIRRPA